MSSTSWTRPFTRRLPTWRHTTGLALLLLPLLAWAETPGLTAPTTTTLTATKTVNVLTIPQSGGELVYGIHVTNTGSSVARNVIMGDNIPANATFVSTLPGCSFQPGSAFGRGIVVCVPQDVAPGATIATQVVVRADANLPCGTQIVNVGDVEATNVPLLWTNKVMTTVTCPSTPIPTPTPTPFTPASLSIHKTVSVSTVPQSGGLITYTIRVTNTGSTVARGVLIGDNIPANATLVPGTTDCAFQPGSIFGRGIIVCVRQDVAPGQTLTKQFTVQSDAGLACGTQITNVADVEAFNLPPNWSNKVMTRVDCPVTPTPTPTVTVTPTPTPKITPTPTPKITPTPTPKITPTPTPKITPTPTPTVTVTPTVTPTATPTPTPTPEVKKGIDVTKTDHRDITRPGHNLTYTITVENTSNVDLHDVRITDDVPQQLTVASITRSGQHRGSQIIWSGVTLSAGEKKEFSYTATVKLETANGHLLVNDVKACSNDHNICDVATDTTRVERQPQIAGVTTTPTTQVVTPSGQVIHVPITAPTGAGALGGLATLIGGGSLTLLLKKFW